MTHKHRKKLLNFIFQSAGCSLLGAKGFSCSFDISKLQFLSKKTYKKILLNFFSFVFGHQNPGSGLDLDSLEKNAGSGSGFNES
jgi:hypothetical protein